MVASMIAFGERSGPWGFGRAPGQSEQEWLDALVATMAERPRGLVLVTGRKPMRTTEWGERLMVRRRPWLGRNVEDIRWAFFDHALIESLGCGSCINAPVAAFGRVYGTLNVLDAPLAYDQAQVPVVEAIASFLVEPLRRMAEA